MIVVSDQNVNFLHSGTTSTFTAFLCTTCMVILLGAKQDIFASKCKH